MTVGEVVGRHGEIMHLLPEKKGVDHLGVVDLHHVAQETIPDLEGGACHHDDIEAGVHHPGIIGEVEKGRDILIERNTPLTILPLHPPLFLRPNLT